MFWLFRKDFNLKYEEFFIGFNQTRFILYGIIAENCF